MAENSVSQLTPIINENGLKYVEHEGQVSFLPKKSVVSSLCQAVQVHQYPFQQKSKGIE